jgi:hypothetical protein
VTITAIGFDGTVNEAAFAKLQAYIGHPSSVGALGHFSITPVVGVDRTVRLAAGDAYQDGVWVNSDANIDLQGGTVATGTRWDTIVLRRNWSTNAVTAVLVAGTSTRAVATGLNATPGTLSDQVLGIVQFTAGQTSPTTIVDMRRVYTHPPASVDVAADVPNKLAGEVFYERSSGKNWQWNGSLLLPLHMTDTGVITAGVTGVTGVQSTANITARMRMLFGIIVNVSLDCVTSIAHSSGSTANMTDIKIANVPAPFRPSTTTYFVWNGGGVVAGTGYIASTGDVVLSTMTSASFTLPSGSNIHIDATYLAAGV